MTATALLTAWAAALTAAAPVTNDEPSLPAGAWVLPLPVAPKLLRQCSRNAPQAQGPFHEPAAAEIREAERAVIPVLLEGRRHDLDVADFPGDFTRQYVGYVRGGRRLIYGNAVRADQRVLKRIPPGTEPLIMCDGDGNAFGYEFDPNAREITAFAVNGPNPYRPHVPVDAALRNPLPRIPIGR